ncbi:RagB/SusD family nutrient uptake outer membrane protein [Flavihumibacter fluvii]|uniref:RagB/SusD family nutrient uptake outer membrane protein n=1 Tax=Flavihumibacter fluvii TaxID=2838157 RepID=UPI001BDE9D56|nr:RagB/SusD family nutrient uptake outer membrane protein [Flavihumibacter fluvii]ULQ51452.1 RagB/SusD family nutrient uptake outer membrane protein [Flavihumibacter fluvii]
MNLSIRYIAFFLAFGIMVSCQKLDVVSPNDVASEDVFKDANGLRSALIGLYSTLQQRDYYGGYYPLIADLNSDIAKAGGYDNPALNEIGDHAVTSSNIYVEQIYVALYKSLNNANAIIEAVDQIVDAGLSEEERNKIKGEALAVRAMIHFDLLRMYGYHWDNGSEYGIPVVTTVQGPYDIVPRNSVAETYAAIIKDLTDAVSLLSTADINAKYMNQPAAKALLARVYLYQKNFAQAATLAREVIDEGSFSLLDADNFSSIYSGRLSSESVFELSFDTQNPSFYNGTTFVREDALRSEVLFVASEGVKIFFELRPDDRRISLLDFENNDPSILPDGRTQKYRGEVAKDNPAYILRIAEMYLIAAEAKGLAGGGLDELNTLRINRGLEALVPGDIETEDAFQQLVADEREAELNFEGHRFFDLARTQKINEVLGIEQAKGVFPIPQRELIASKDQVKQNPGF